MMKEAMAAYDQAIRADPKSARVYNNRGNAYRRSGRYHNALLDYNQAIRLAPQLAEAYAGRAFVYTHLNKDEAAQADVVQAVKLGFNPILLEGEIEGLTQRRPPGEGRDNLPQKHDSRPLRR